MGTNELSQASCAIEVPEPATSPSSHEYVVYGFRLRSAMKLSLSEAAPGGAADIDLLPGEEAWFERTTSQFALDHSHWINVHESPEGWSYVRYEGMFEFMVSPSGNRVLYRLLEDVSLDSFETYALGRIFSFAMVKKGFEPLHASTVVVDGCAVAFLGSSTFGKSSLAARFVADGHQLLTDDVLRAEEQPDGRVLAFPGPPRLKLMPIVARRLMRDTSLRAPINSRGRHPKRIYPLTAAQYCAEPVPLRAIYAVTPPRNVHRKQRITIAPLPPVRALMKLLTFTHNDNVTGGERLARQFDAAQRLLRTVPIRALSYPRILTSLSEVKAAVLADLQ